MTPEFSILDNHIHLDPKGLGVEGARKFQKAGGTHLILVHKPYHHIPRGDYKRQFGVTLQLAEQIRKSTNVVVYTALCPHPADLTGFLKKSSLKEATEKIRKGIDLAAQYIREGIVLAIGESGRPHYPVKDNVWEAANNLIEYTLGLAKDLDCAVQFHTEGGEGSFRDIAAIATDVGYPLKRCVKHFSGPAVLEEENYGLFPSIVARENSIKKAITKGNRFLMETDFIDERSRPNVVLPPTAVPELTLKLLENDIFTMEDILMIHRDYPEKVYHIDVDVL